MVDDLVGEGTYRPAGYLVSRRVYERKHEHSPAQKQGREDDIRYTSDRMHGPVSRRVRPQDLLQAPQEE